MSSVSEAHPKFGFVLDTDLSILMVADDRESLDLAQLHLAKPGLAIETALGADAGLRALDGRPFDLVLVDAAAPGVAALHMIEHIRTRPKWRHMPILVVAQAEDIDFIERAYDAGATSFATRPTDWRVLGSQLRYLLRAQGLLAA